MPVPIITGEAIIVGDEGATLRHTQNGQPVSNARLKFSDRRRNDDGSWSDTSVLWIDATAWGPLAERLAEVGQGGVVLKVSGRLDTQEWEQDAQKRSKPRLTLDMLEPKPQRNQLSTQSGGFGGSQPAAQPGGGWGGQPSDGSWGSGSWDTPPSSEPPF